MIKIVDKLLGINITTINPEKSIALDKCNDFCKEYNITNIGNKESREATVILCSLLIDEIKLLKEEIIKLKTNGKI